MRNVTITLDDETAKWARIEAARRDTSVSRFVGELLHQHMADMDRYERARGSYLRREGSPISTGSAGYPTRDELHER